MKNNNIINSASIDNILVELTVPYNDKTVLTNSSKELDTVNKYFDSVTCGNKDIETLLYEVIGYALTKTAKLNKAFLFKGAGRNGKSKIFRVLEALLGAKQCSHEHLEYLSGSKAGSKTTVSALRGCTVNIAEDQKQPNYVNTSLITRLISGETISIEQNGNDRVDLIPYATLLFSVNEVIDFKETGIYITDRFVVIPFNNTFTDDNNNRNINIGEELCQPKALQIIATRAIERFEKVLENGKFSIPKIVEEETRNYFMECNNVAEFCNLYPIKTFIIKSNYYEEYKKWCKNNNREVFSNSKFGKEVLALGYRAERYSFGNKRETYYASPKFNNADSRKIYNDYLVKIGLTEETVRNCDEDYLKEKYDAIPFDDYLCENLYKKTNEIENA